MFPFHAGLDLSPKEAACLFSNPDYVWIDVREKREFEFGHLNLTQNLPLSDLTIGHFDSFDKNKKWVVLCRSGSRSRMVVETMQKMGYENVINLHGGLLALNEEIKEKIPVLQH